MVQVLYVRVASPGTHESHITDVKWYDAATGNMNTANLATMIDFIANKKGRAYVCDGRQVTTVSVVSATPAAYIQANPDASKSDNLLKLPRF